MFHRDYMRVKAAQYKELLYGQMQELSVSSKSDGTRTAVDSVASHSEATSMRASSQMTPSSMPPREVANKKIVESSRPVMIAQRGRQDEMNVVQARRVR